MIVFINGTIGGLLADALRRTIKGIRLSQIKKDAQIAQDMYLYSGVDIAQAILTQRKEEL